MPKPSSIQKLKRRIKWLALAPFLLGLPNLLYISTLLVMGVALTDGGVPTNLTPYIIILVATYLLLLLSAVLLLTRFVKAGLILGALMFVVNGLQNALWVLLTGVEFELILIAMSFLGLIVMGLGYRMRLKLEAEQHSAGMALEDGSVSRLMFNRIV